MNNTKFGIGSLAAALLATMLTACSASPVVTGSSVQTPPAQAYSHDAYFY